MADNRTVYDVVPYPSAIFRQCHPDRLAVIARLHGLAPPPVETARMLEIGGGDGLNAIAIATAFPRAEFLNFDLASVPIERGRRWSAMAGLTNIRHEAIDILDAADQIEGSYDYIVAHGVYAWVPDRVRAAIFPLIKRLLASNGVAFVSYNALPGGHSRMALREMMLHHVAAIADPRKRVAAARSLLRDFVGQREGDEPIVAAMRREAEATLRQPDELILHDELGEIYAPQAFADVAAAAERNGLIYLAEAGKGALARAFVDPADGDPALEALVRKLQAQDYIQGRYFHSSVFVHAGAAPSRLFDPDRLRSMWVSAHARHVGGDVFGASGIEIEVSDPRLADALRLLVDGWPGRRHVTDLFDTDDHLAALFRLCDEGLADFHTTAAPFTLDPGDRPLASPIARALIADGHGLVPTLDHRSMEIGDPRARAFITLLDGTRSRSEIARDWAASDWAEEVPVEQAMRLVTSASLLVK